MLYTYTYRGSNGALCQGELEAGSRNEVFAMLKVQGVSPLAVREGADSKFRAGQRHVGCGRGVIAGMLIVVAAMGVFMLISRGKKPSDMPLDKHGTDISRSKAAFTAKKGSVAEKTSRKVAATLRVDAECPSTATNQEDAVSEYTATNKPGVVPVKGTFKTGTEQVLSLIFTCPLGSPPPPLPRIGKIDRDRMWQILTSENIVEESDTEKAADAKRTVELAKRELKDYLQKGGDFDEFLTYYRSQLMQAHHQWQDSQHAVIQACRHEDPEVARAMFDEVNKRLREKGIKPIMLPPVFRKKLGLER